MPIATLPWPPTSDSWPNASSGAGTPRVARLRRWPPHHPPIRQGLSRRDARPRARPDRDRRARRRLRDHHRPGLYRAACHHQRTRHHSAQTSIGPFCKVGGEVAGTIFQAYSNKGHYGHRLIHTSASGSTSGAATNNSNLLNTYGEIIAKATPHSSNERTGQQFLGCVLGDHVKTAHGMRIMTGSIVGTATMWAATEPVSGCVSTRFSGAPTPGSLRVPLREVHRSCAGDDVPARRESQRGVHGTAEGTFFTTE